MGQINKAQIIKLAHLCRLNVTEQEIVLYRDQLGAIMDYFKLLDRLDTTGLKPTYQVCGLVNVERADVVIDYGTDQSSLLKNLPDAQDKYIKVSRMVA
jgi:aspartyl-tRNA(Asn)/glutamyl-tRNA(Gln) amidotransferase subunit C